MFAHDVTWIQNPLNAYFVARSVCYLDLGSNDPLSLTVLGSERWPALPSPLNRSRHVRHESPAESPAASYASQSVWHPCPQCTQSTTHFDIYIIYIVYVYIYICISIYICEGTHDSIHISLTPRREFHATCNSLVAALGSTSIDAFFG